MMIKGLLIVITIHVCVPLLACAAVPHCLFDTHSWRMWPVGEENRDEGGRLISRGINAVGQESIHIRLLEDRHLSVQYKIYKSKNTFEVKYQFICNACAMDDAHKMFSSSCYRLTCTGHAKSNDPSPNSCTCALPASSYMLNLQMPSCLFGMYPYFKERSYVVVAAGTAILVLTLVVVSIQPLFVSPAFATLTAGTATATATATAGARLFRSEILTSAWTGFFAGCLHTLSGPDHLAALAPLSIGRTRMESAAVGGLWGCGHDAGQVIFGLLFLLLKDRLHIEVIRTWGTRVVGFTLLVIGAMGIKEATEVQVPNPCVVLENGECDVSDYESLENPASGKKKIGFATFATGIVHGLQPDALMMVLPALALPSRLAGAAFLGMFLVGTVASMGSYTVFIGSCSQALKQRIPRITEKLTWASSLIAIALGFGIILSPFFGFSLY